MHLLSRFQELLARIIFAFSFVPLPKDRSVGGVLNTLTLSPTEGLDISLLQKRNNWCPGSDTKLHLAQSAGTVEDADYISAEW